MVHPRLAPRCLPLLLAVALGGWSSAAEGDTAPSPSSAFAFESSPLASLHARLVAAIEDPSVLQGWPDLAPLLPAYREAQERFPPSLQLPSGEVKGEEAARTVWQLLFSIVSQVTAPAELAARAASLPPLAGGTLDAGSILSRLAGAIEPVWPRYLESGWPVDQRAVDDGLAWWREHAAPHEMELIGLLRRLLSLPAADPPLRVILVPVLGGKGAVTLRTPAGAMIALGLSDHAGSARVEALLHEAAHALDTRARGQAAPARLGAALAADKASPFVIRQGPHALIFAAAAETTRRAFDPAHVPIGVRGGAYARGLGPLVEVIQPVVTAQAEAGDAAADLVPLLVPRLLALPRPGRTLAGLTAETGPLPGRHAAPRRVVRS